MFQKFVFLALKTRNILFLNEKYFVFKLYKTINRLVLYCFTWLLSYRFYQASINRYFFLVQNDMDHLLTSAGVWSPPLTNLRLNVKIEKSFNIH